MLAMSGIRAVQRDANHTRFAESPTAQAWPAKAIELRSVLANSAGEPADRYQWYRVISPAPQLGAFRPSW